MTGMTLSFAFAGNEIINKFIGNYLFRGSKHIRTIIKN